MIMDTAGRLHIDDDLMAELARIKAKTDPTEILLVADAMTGQDAVNVAKHFNDLLDITGVVLTKMEGDARGGAALSLKAVTDKPIKYVEKGLSAVAGAAWSAFDLANRIKPNPSFEIDNDMNGMPDAFVSGFTGFATLSCLATLAGLTTLTGLAATRSRAAAARP